MKQIQKITIRTPHLVNGIFLLLLALGAVGFSFSYQYTSASPLESYCERQYQNYRFGPLLPVAKKCEKIFQRKTVEWMTGIYSK